MQYRILSPGSSQQTLHLFYQPAGTSWTAQTQVDVPPLLQNAAATGTFSAGALTAGAGPWFLNISASSDSDVIVDNITVFRQAANVTDQLPLSWSNLDRLPFPRLGQYMLGTTLSQAEAGGLAEGPPLRVSEDQIENALAFADVILGIDADAQTQSPDSIRRLRQLNPNAVILPYRIAEEQSNPFPQPFGADISLDYDFFAGVPDSWYLKNTEGNYVPDPVYTFLLKMNISPYSPVVNGDAYFSYLLKWLNTSIYPSGIWDGHFFDNLFGRINSHILNSSNPSLLDVDYQGTEVRNETPAWVSDMTRTAAIGMLQQWQSMTQGSQLIVGNVPEPALAPYLNGSTYSSAWTAAGVLP